jgi:hypothetical protein
LMCNVNYSWFHKYSSWKQQQIVSWTT